MNAKRMFLFVGVAIVTATATVASVDKTAAEKIASARLADAGVTAQVGAGYAGAKRYTFKFEGYKAYFDEPVAAKPGRPWMWCMKWPDAFAEFTGQVDCVRRGYYYVYLDDIDWMSPKGVEIAKRFHDFLVEKLGFHPEDVSRIYLDAPLMNFASFNLSGWPAAKVWGSPEGGDWSKDPRMPINLADKIAKAKIPVLLLYGGADTVVPPSKNCEIFIPRFKAAGGNIKVFKRDMYGHHPHGFQGAENVGAIVDFFEGKPVSVK